MNLILLIIYNIFQNSIEQPVIIHIQNEEGNGTEDKEYKPTIETKQLKDKDGNQITITRINYQNSKNLNDDFDRITPFRIMRIFDDRISNFFEEIIRQSLNGFNFEPEENENTTKKELDLDLDEEEEEEEEEEKNKTSISEKNTEKEKVENVTKNTEKKTSPHKVKRNITKIGKMKVDINKIKNMKKKQRKKLTRKEIIFSRVCKYIFYSIIIFTVYILVRKLLHLMDIIDLDSNNEVNPHDEELSELKNRENKQSKKS